MVTPSRPAPAVVLPRGAALGRYVVIEQLGQGGMGVVYKAYDPELDRKLAVKVLRAAAADPEVARERRARLVREGQVMARLSHPNVIAVHDVGSFDDQVFVAMELVEGETLRAWLKKPRPWREVVAMFVQAGRGLHAAHAEGIVHRDFKPDNVIVGKDGRARVLDFGLANAAFDFVASGDAQLFAGELSSDSFEASRSAAGAIVGTPRYMAFEQLVGESTDASTDQFGFCASLWEAVYGEPPFEGDDLLTLVDNIGAGKLRQPAAHGVPASVRQALTRGLSPKPLLRFPSMSALLGELERDSGATRRRWLVAAGLGAALGASVFGVRALDARRAPVCPGAEPELAGVWDVARKGQMATAFRATRTPYAEDALRGTSRALDDYAAAWVTMRGDACAATRVRGEQSSDLLDLRMECLDQRLGEVKAIVDQLVVADANTVEGALRAADGLAPLSRCADASSLRAPMRIPADAATRARIEEVHAQVASARALDDGSRFADALRVAGDAVAAAKALGYPPIQAEALEVQGVLFDSAGDAKHAASALEDAVIAAVAGRDEATEAQAWVDLVDVAEKDARQADGHDLARHAYAALARSPDETRMAALLTYDASLADDDEKLDVALAKLDQALALEEKRLPADHPVIAATLSARGYSLFHQGRYDDAVAVYERALSIREKAFGPAHPLVAEVYEGMANVLSGKGDYDGAIAMYRRALDVYVAAHGLENRSVADTLSAMGLALAYSHKADEAIDAEKRALAIDERILPPGHDDIANSLINEAEAYGWAGRYADEIVAARRSLAMIEASKGPTAPRLVNPLTQLGDALTKMGRLVEARDVTERALAIEEASASEPLGLATTRHVLASILRATGDTARARKLAAQARATLMLEPVGNAEAIRELDREFPPSRGER